ARRWLRRSLLLAWSRPEADARRRRPASARRGDRGGVAPRRAADVRGLLEQAVLRLLARVDLRPRRGPLRTAAALLRVQGAHGGRSDALRRARERGRPRDVRDPAALDDRSSIAR